MILEPKPVPTIIKVDRAFIEKHDPNRYTVNRYFYPKSDRKKSDLCAKLKLFLKVPHNTNEIVQHMDCSYSYLRTLLLRIGAKNVLRGRGRNPGVWSL